MCFQHSLPVLFGAGSGVIEHPNVVIDVLLYLLDQYPHALEQCLGFVEIVLGTFDQGCAQLLRDRGKSVKTVAVGRLCFVVHRAFPNVSDNAMIFL